MQQKQYHEQAGAEGDLNRVPSSQMPCCGSGCAVCVLDYPDLFPDRQCDAETQALLEAIEQSQLQAEQMIAQIEGIAGSRK